MYMFVIYPFEYKLFDLLVKCLLLFDLLKMFILLNFFHKGIVIYIIRVPKQQVSFYVEHW